jgi:hypothetical protein
MRMAFLPGLVMLAGGMAWGQTATSALPPPVQAAERTEAPVVVLQAQHRSSEALVLKQEKALTLALEQKGLALVQLKAERNQRPETSQPEPIPTQWPHAKAELIPTQWPKVRIELVGGGPARAAKPSAESTGAAVVVPR